MKKERRKVILVGAGPGDPDLITLKGVQALRQADVIIYDYLANEKLLEYCPADVEKIYVGKKGGAHTLPQESINRLLVEKAREEKLVVRLKGGDPLVFGRGGEEILALAEANIDFEVIPGVTSGIAALTYAGIPATHRGDATSVSFITGHEDPSKTKSGLNWPAISQINGTLVFYMGVKNLPNIVKNLCGNGKPPETPVAVVRWGTLPGQQVVTGTLETIVETVEKAQIKPPALIVVGEVIQFRDKMNWFEKKPLFGKRIVNTRARAQSSDLTRALQNFGAQVVEFPTIRIEPPESWEPLNSAIRNLQKYDWIIFTSVNGVESFARQAKALQFDPTQLNGTRIAAIGPATARRLAEFGMEAHLQPKKFVAEALLDALQQETELTGKHILMPRAELSRSLLKDELVKSGAVVDEIVAYRTLLEKDNQAAIVADLKANKIDLVTFTSSSTVNNFVDLIGRENIFLLKNAGVACIGPITQQTAAEYGIATTVAPEDYTIPGLVQAIVDFYLE